MIKKLSAIGLLMLLFGAPAAAGAPDDDDILYKFALYTQKVYLADAMENLGQNAFSPAVIGKIFSPRVLGYSVGNLLKYARRGSENYRIWLRLNHKAQEGLFEIIEQQGAREGWVIVEIEERKQDALTQYIGAQQHWFDDDMVRETGVKPNEAPNFFESLTGTPPPSPPVQPPVQPPVNPPVNPPSPPVPPAPPPITPPAPPTLRSRDMVGGTYKVIGESWVNDPRCGSTVTLTGSMLEVEAEYKFWDWTGVTWHYKGTAKWEVMEYIEGPHKLIGATQDLLRNLPDNSPIRQALEVRIARSDDGIWRADSINIGGNPFQLAQVEGIEREIQGKILMIRNTTPFEIYVYFDIEKGLMAGGLGPVGPKSDRTFSNIPERGRWYVTIATSPATYLKSYSYMLYVKEATFGYFFEVQEGHLR